MPPSETTQTRETPHWPGDVRDWLSTRWKRLDCPQEDVISFFERAFENTRCPDHAWFGLHSDTVSLVAGGLFLAAIMKPGKYTGFWLAVDQDPPFISGVRYHPMEATKQSEFQLLWARSESMAVIADVLANDAIWASYASASEKIPHIPRYGADRDSVQEQRNKKRLSDFRLTTGPLHLFPDEVTEDIPIREGALHRVTVNAYERDASAREKCIAHYGTSCSICGFSFGEAYGRDAEGFIHVHHLQPLSEIGAEYTVDPIKDLRPVCPNCHAVLHIRKPAFSIEEVRSLLRGKESRDGEL